MSSLALLLCSQSRKNPSMPPFIHPSSNPSTHPSVHSNDQPSVPYLCMWLISVAQYSVRPEFTNCRMIPRTLNLATYQTTSVQCCFLYLEMPNNECVMSEANKLPFHVPASLSSSFGLPGMSNRQHHSLSGHSSGRLWPTRRGPTHLCGKMSSDWRIVHVSSLSWELVACIQTVCLSDSKAPGTAIDIRDAVSRYLS